MARLKITVAYEGTRFAGWQLQAMRSGECPLTVQGELERAAAAITCERVVVYGSGRTDSGVHAEAQVCHMDVPEDKAGLDWARALNSLLPPDIRVRSADLAPADFHARFSATGKCYAYSLWMGAQRPLPRAQAFTWHTPELDLQRMQAAAAYLVGHHDFASFQNTGTPQDSTVRTLFSVQPKGGFLGPLQCPEDWPVLTWVFEGNGFLKQMVRNLVGLLVWTGQGKLDPAIVSDILAAKDRKALPSPSAPAQGLTLMRVYYESK